ncbi:MAG: hypothetical protein HWN65_21375 [Candidatus Helarchaeota archaeon]|nr:hypothetical protein [Candidatus Helarchaeota archaeon]
MEVEFPDIIETISQMQAANTRFITVKRLRKYLRIESENGKMIRKISNTLVWLTHFGYLDVVQSRSPKRYRILPDFSQKTRDIVRIYRR